jgi:hypothetical protein
VTARYFEITRAGRSRVAAPLVPKLSAAQAVGAKSPLSKLDASRLHPVGGVMDFGLPELLRRYEQ